MTQYLDRTEKRAINIIGTSDILVNEKIIKFKIFVENIGEAVFNPHEIFFNFLIRKSYIGKIKVVFNGGFHFEELDDFYKFTGYFNSSISPNLNYMVLNFEMTPFEIDIDELNRLVRENEEIIYFYVRTAFGQTYPADPGKHGLNYDPIFDYGFPHAVMEVNPMHYFRNSNKY